MNKDLVIIKFFVVLALLLMIKVNAAATTYYVSSAGSDRNDGSQSAPLKTLEKAAEMVRAGDTVYVRQGTYAGFAIANKNGTSTAWITFKPYPGESATIDPYKNNYATGNGKGVDILAGSYIEINGFEITDSNPLYDSQSFADYSHGQNKDAIKLDSSGRIKASFIRIAGNHIYRIGGTGVQSTYGVTNCEIIDNKIENVGLSKRGYGIYVGGNYNIIKRNIIHDAYGHGIQVYIEGGPSLNYNIIEENVCYDNGHADYGAGYISGRFPAKGRRVGDGIVVSVGRRSASEGTVIKNNKVYNNINNGIEIKHSYNASVLYNVAYDNGYQGFNVADNINAVVMNNSSYGSRNEDGSSGNAFIGRANIEDHNRF